MGKIKDGRAVEPLMAALKDDSLGTRIEATYALEQIGDARAVKPLINLLRDKSADLRLRAVSALGEIGDIRAKEPLLQVRLHDEDSEIRSRADAELKKLGWAPEEAPKPAAQKPKPKSPEALLRDLQSDFENERIEAAKALGEAGNDKVLDQLVYALRIETRQGALEAIAQALGKIGAHSMNSLMSVLIAGIDEGGRTSEMIRDALPFIRKSLIEQGSPEASRIAELTLRISRRYH